MTKVYELPNGHRMVADIDESTRVCNITETTLDSIVSKLNYYAEQTDVLDKIKAEIGKSKTEHEMQLDENNIKGKLLVSHIYCDIVSILDKYTAEKE